MLGVFSDWLRHLARRRRWTATQALGRRGEDLAHRFLRRQGYTIVARNYRLPAGDGEADLIAWDGDTLVIVEVKARQSDEYGERDHALEEHAAIGATGLGRGYCGAGGARLLSGGNFSCPQP